MKITCIQKKGFYYWAPTYVTGDHGALFHFKISRLQNLQLHKDLCLTRQRVDRLGLQVKESNPITRVQEGKGDR